MSELRDALLRIVQLGAARHPAGAHRKRVERAIGRLTEGIAPADALRDAGVREEIAAFVADTRPADLPRALGGLAAAVGAAERRRSAMASAALYPFLCAASAAFLAVIVLALLRPAMTVAASAAHPISPAPAIATAAAASLGIAALLVLLGGALLSRRPLPPFLGPRRVHERAAVLSVADQAAKSGCPLPVALRAAARFSADPAIAEDASALAAALGRGEARSGTLLLGELGASLLAASAPKGGANAVLTAIADLLHVRADAELSSAVLRAEILSLALAGTAVLLAALGWFAAYTQPFGAFP